jgi:hypothetical protein
MRERLPIPVVEIICALEREAANTDTDPRWLAARCLRSMDQWETRTLMCRVDTRPSTQETRPAPDDRWIQHEHTAAHDCACRDCVAAETSVTRCSCKDFPGSDQFCTAHKCNCAGTAPTMPTFRTEHLSTCPCSAANR